MAVQAICFGWTNKTWCERDCGDGSFDTRRLLWHRAPHQPTNASLSPCHEWQYCAGSKKPISFGLFKQFDLTLQATNDWFIESAQVPHAWPVGSMLGDFGSTCCSIGQPALSPKRDWYSSRWAPKTWHACICWFGDSGKSVKARRSQSMERSLQSAPTSWVARGAIGRRHCKPLFYFHATKRLACPNKKYNPI